MLAGPSDRIVLAALLAAAWAGACSPEIPVRPFRVELTSGGAPYVPDPTSQVLSGTANREGPGSLSVAPAGVTIRFDTSTGASFPADLVGAVDVFIDYDAAATDPQGAPLPVRGIRIADHNPPNVGLVRFVLFESTASTAEGRPLVPRVAQQLGFEDIPLLDTVASYAEFEPSSCGDRYYDLLRVKAPNLTPLFLLDRGERRSATTDPAAPPWTVLHVLSWHRSGHLCSRRAHSWIQVAEWRCLNC